MTAAVNAQNRVNASTAQLALAALANNGGPTPTRLPGAASIAIDEGRESFCTATDQRHFVRADASCDIGAMMPAHVPIAMVPHPVEARCADGSRQQSRPLSTLPRQEQENVEPASWLMASPSGLGSR